MNLRKLVCEHTIDVDLLPKKPLVLDVGCRMFNFCEEILALRPEAAIVAMDPGPDIEPPTDTRILFVNFALIETEQEFAYLKMAGCESVYSLTPVPGWAKVPVRSPSCIFARWPYFDLIKFDCEGAEFEILENWPGPVAGQINIEFHDNRKSVDGKGLPQSYFDAVFAGMPDYKVVQNEPDYLGTHADCLLVLK